MTDSRAWAFEIRDLVEALMIDAVDVLKDAGMTFLGTRVDSDVLQVALLMNNRKAVVLRRTRLDHVEVRSLFDPLRESDIAGEIVMEAALRPSPGRLVLVQPGVYAVGDDT